MFGRNLGSSQISPCATKGDKDQRMRVPPKQLSVQLDAPSRGRRVARHGAGISWVRLLELTPRVAVESTRLPGTFRKDPADQIIVATARALDCPLVTLDHKIRGYAHGTLLP